MLAIRAVRPALCAVVTVVVIGLAGCGGGGRNGSSAKDLARQRAIATTRIARSIFAVAGIGRRATGSDPMPMGSMPTRGRITLLLSALHRGRDVQQGLDEGTGLTYTMTTNPDGSGRQDLFADAARQKPAGQLIWGAPQWNGGVPNTYPAVFHIVYQITAGDFAGERGTIDLTLNDASGLNGLIHLILTDAEGDNCTADMRLNNGVWSATDQVILGDGTQYTEDDTTQPDGTMVCTMTFADGYEETMTMDEDGGGSETITDPNGNTQATGDYRSDGTETITYDDGSEETYDVDTGEQIDYVRVVRPAAMKQRDMAVLRSIRRKAAR